MEFPQIILVLIIIAIFVAFFRFDAARTKKNNAAAKAHVDRLLGDVKEYIDQLNHSQAFPTIDMANVNAQRGEFGILHESTTLFELKSHRVGASVGTRVKIGKVPIYLGSHKSHSVEGWEPAADGDFFLTNKRFVFVGSSRSANIALKDMIGLETELGAIRIHTSKRQKPYLFRVSNGLMWSLLAKYVSSVNMESPMLSSGLRMDYTSDNDGTNANVELTPVSLA